MTQNSKQNSLVNIGKEELSSKALPSIYSDCEAIEVELEDYQANNESSQSSDSHACRNYPNQRYSAYFLEYLYRMLTEVGGPPVAMLLAYGIVIAQISPGFFPIALVATISASTYLLLSGFHFFIIRR